MKKIFYFIALLILALIIVRGGLVFVQAQTFKVYPSRLKAQIESITDSNSVNEPEERNEDMVDPREIKDVTRQIKDLTREINRLLKKVKKLGLSEDINKLTEIITRANQFAQNIKNPPADMTQREALQEFYEAQLWDEINAIRIRAEFPQEVKNIEKELKRVEKMLNIKTFQNIGLDIEKIKAYINEIKVIVEEAKRNYAAGAFDELEGALEPIHQGSHPGEVNCILNSFREANQKLKQIKDPDIRELIEELLDPIKAEIDEGNYREACRVINDIRPELERIFQSVWQKKGGLSPKMENSLQKLEDLIRQKFESEPEKILEEKNKEAMPEQIR